MADRHDYLALDWVKDEIQDTLNQAQQALEAFVENPDDSTRMRFCQTYLHQVYGTLQMVEFYGAGLLAEEMEKLAQALIEGRVTRQEDAQETLMRAILQLPPYLDRVQASRRDLPLVLLPLLNDIRAARGDSLLSETSLFKPDLGAGAGQGAVPAPVASDPSFPQLARKIRQMYQIALLGVIRGERLDESYRYMGRVFGRLCQVTGDAPMAPVWNISLAVVDGLAAGAIQPGSSLKSVLGHVDRVLRDLARDGAPALSHTPPPELLKNLLYFLARCEHETPRITRIRELYRLDEALPSEELVERERERMSGPDQSAMTSVVEAISEELTRVKDALEQFTGDGGGDVSRLRAEAGVLKQVADTVAVLGLGQPRNLILEQMKVLEAMAAGERPADRDGLMDVAGALLYIEATLQGLAGDRRYREGSGVLARAPDHVEKAMDSVIRECRAALELAKDGIVEFIASHWDQSHLAEVPARLTAVRGGLELIDLRRPAVILRQCVAYISEHLLGAGAGAPEWRAMDTLADAITGVEYYLERLSDDPETSDDILDLARRSVAQLGYEISDEEFGRAGEGATTEAPAPQPEPVVADAAGHDDHAPREEPAPAEAAPDAIDFTLDADLAIDTDTTDAAGPAAAMAAEADAELLGGAPAAAAPSPMPAIDLPPVEEGDPDLIDDEIVEIFVEEAGEVLAALDEYFPRWAADQNDEQALVEFRRAFHTLKGSGRMVGAMTVGELAWSIENMMNRVIDRTIEPSPVLIELVRTVHGLIPALVEAFGKRQPPPFNVDPLRAAAFTLAEGGSIEAVPDVTGTAFAVSAADETPQPGNVDVLDLESVEEPAPVADADDTVADDGAAAADGFVLEEIEFEPAASDDAGPASDATAARDDEITLDGFEIDFTAEPGDLTLAGEDDTAGETAGTGPAATDLDPDALLAGAGDAAAFDADDVEEISFDLPAAAAADTDEAVAGPAPAAGVIDPDELEGSDWALIDIFRAEAGANAGMLRAWLDGLDPDLSKQDIDDTVHRALHTLKGSARMAELEQLAAVAEPAEHYVKALVNGCNARADRAAVALIREVVEAIETGLAQLDAGTGGVELAGSDDLIRRLRQATDEVVPELEHVGRGRGVLSLFLAEGMDLIMDAEDLLARWAAAPGETAELARLRDELGQLSRSAARVNIIEISLLAEALAAVYDAVLAGRLAFSEAVLEPARRGQDTLVNMMDFLAAGQGLLRDAALLAELRALAGLPPDGGPGSGTRPPAAVTPEPVVAAPAPAPVPASTPPVASFAEDDEPEAADEIDQELVDIFLEEAREVLESASGALDAWQDGDAGPVPGLQRDLHTLKGGARMAGLNAIGDLAHELENLYEGVNQGRFGADGELFTLLHRCHDRLADMVEEVARRGGCRRAPELVAAIQAFLAGEPVPQLPVTPVAPAAPAPASVAIAPDPAPASPASAAPAVEPVRAPLPERDEELVGIFLEEADEILESAGTSLESWMEAPDNLIEVQSLQRDLHTLKGGARMAEVPELGDLGHEMENLYEGLALGTLKATPVMFELLQRCHDRLAVMVEDVKANRPLQPARELIRAIRHYMDDPDGFVLPPLAPGDASTARPSAAPVAPTQPVAATAADTGRLDADVLRLFLDEAGELDGNLEAALDSWLQAPSAESGEPLRRILNTLKGGARLAGLTALGDLCQQFEEALEGADLDAAPAPALRAQIQSWRERILGEVGQLRAALERRAEAAAAPVPAPSAAAAPAAPATADDRQQRPEAPRRPAAQQPQEMVRIGADVLEALVNLAGETSINRGRVEQGITEFALHVTEMGNTIERLYEQLRRLDVETEAQIMSNYQQGLEAGQYDADFDPLEMDQYSELHQITRQLSESASDLLDLKNTLLDKTRDTETLLLQQSRINTELQEKLMRTRMVPFSRLVPRLRRIVRQVSGEIGKQVDFQVVNPEGELDRTLMERIVAPLEHMLRNAVDHGVEPPDERVRAGKDATGRVTLELGREGGEVVLILADDGRGIDTDAVRRKAIERGLIDEDTLLTEQEIQQFIFSAGFSTAQKVTQISGRGVGMDVVASEIKQMGGSVSIESTLGHGTRFIVRLPFTLAMNRALMIRVGEDQYAIPLNQIEGIVRVSPYELEGYFGEAPKPFTYAGQKYELAYMGEFVHGARHPAHLMNHPTPLPVLLVRSSEHQVAILVDGLIGSREVVVKSVGPQLSTVAGISGATILGDGSVVIILDIHSLIRAAHMQRQHQIERRQRLPKPGVAEPAAPALAEARMPLIMVTDDSVTVRKVTSRLLERNGYEVITAKDGVDAVTRLEERVPDLMLLDIEMPRMDGFEVAMHVRHDERLKDVPIIMITSRTGEKHRERAFDIGVNSYMGKPYQETELLATIRELLSRAREASGA